MSEGEENKDIITFDPDSHDQDTKKSYYHTFDDDTVTKMKSYYKVKKGDNHILLKYLKDNKVPSTTPNDT
jgi:hypothetical protein